MNMSEKHAGFVTQLSMFVILLICQRYVFVLQRLTLSSGLKIYHI
jgi:hypothetical protein